MNLEDLLIPVKHVDIFYAIIAQNGGLGEISRKEELVVSKEALVEIIMRLGGASGSTFQPPSTTSKPQNEFTLEKNEAHLPHNNKDEGSSFSINEFIKPQNEPIPINEKSEENESSKNEVQPQTALFELENSDNQIDHPILPKSLVEDWRKNEKNLIRAIFDYQQFPLKEVADRYGGRSASANLANFMAKSDSDLKNMRKSTAQRLASALQVPLDWILVLKKG